MFLVTQVEGRRYSERLILNILFCVKNVLFFFIFMNPEDGVLNTQVSVEEQSCQEAV